MQIIMIIKENFYFYSICSNYLQVTDISLKSYKKKESTDSKLLVSANICKYIFTLIFLETCLLA